MSKAFLNKKSIWLTIALAIFLSSAELGWADMNWLQSLSRDLKPLKGVVVMTRGNEILIDLDGSHGVQMGDLFSVVTSGQKVIHPVTAKVLGETQKVKSVLKIVGLKDGFSYAKDLTNNHQINIGDPVKRYGNFQVRIIDNTGNGRDVFSKIQKKLPHLMWFDTVKARSMEPLSSDETASIANELIFILNTKELEIRDFEYNLIKSYSVISKDDMHSNSTPNEISSIQGLHDPLATRMDGNSMGTRHSPVVAEPPSVGGYKKKFKTLSTLPVASVIADFIKVGDRLLLVSTEGSEIQILQISDGADQLAAIKPSYYSQILAVKWWLPDVSMPPYVVAVIWADNRVEGILYQFHNDRLISVIEDIPKILGTFDIDGDSIPETLLGQEFEGETFFSQGAEKLVLKENKLESKTLPIKLPRYFSVLGSTIADLTGNGIPESIFVRNDRLYIFSGDTMRYKSAPEIGGSVSFLTYDVDSSYLNSQPATISIEISPIVMDVDGNGTKELFTIASKKTYFGKLGIGPGIEKSYVNMIGYQNGRFVSQPISEEEGLSIQGLAFNDDLLLLIGTMQTGYNADGWTSYLLSLIP
jgi:hypothetical protein